MSAGTAVPVAARRVCRALAGAPRACAALAVLAVLALAGFPAAAADLTATDEARAALARFEPWIGGEWHMQGSIQRFEWGLDRRSVIATSWFEVAGERTPVAAGVWVWHPGERRIRGWFTASGTGADFLEYTTVLREDGMLSDIVSWAADGRRAAQRETWELDGEDRCQWSLFDERGGHFEKSTGGTWERRPAADVREP